MPLFASCDQSAAPAETPRSLLAIAEQLDALPSLPAVANTILDMVLSGEFAHSALARVVETDPALSVKVLNSANSAAYTASGAVTQVEHALTRMGSRAVQALMLSVLIKESLVSGEQGADTAHMALWKHSLATAVLASLIAARVAPEQCGVAFGAGILHDIGRIFLQLHGGQEFVQVQERMGDLYEPILQAEQGVFRTDHTRIGSRIAAAWQLPQVFADVISLHHHDAQTLRDLNMHSGPVPMVALANLLAHAMLMDEPGSLRDTAHLTGLRDLLELSEDDLQAVRRSFAPSYEERARPFNLDGDQVGLFLASLQKANQRLARMSLDLEQTNARLDDASRFATLGSQAGLRLSKARSCEEAFEAVAASLQDMDLIRGGFIYWMVPAERCMQGLFWNSAGNRRIVTYALNGENMPDLDAGVSLPESLRGIVLGHHSRYQGAVLMDRELRLKQFFVQGEYCLFPLAGSEFSGEICLLRAPARPARMTSQEYLGYAQICCVASATLDRIRLFENLQLRADELSMALWRNQQINLKLLQTERLAAVGELAAGAAHEINNPLAIISARTQLLARRETDDKNRRDLQQITEQIGRISAIVKSLMGFAKPTPPLVASVDINTLLGKIIALVESIFLHNSISIVQHLAADLPPVQADAAQLEQVFLNLVINAQHAMEEAGGTLTISSRPHPDGRRVIISIRDTGCGIPSEHMARIFDPFFSTKSEGRGTGLGLSTAYGIVTGHYGEIKADSAVGHGTEMTVILPVTAPQNGAGRGTGATA